MEISSGKNVLLQTIVNEGDWLWNPANIKGANKDAKIYVERSTTLHNFLFSPHTLCMNYVTNTFQLVSCSVRSKELLCFVQGQGQKGEQNHTTNNFVGFHNHSPLLTMCKPNKIANQQNKTPPKILCYTVAHCNISSWDRCLKNKLKFCCHFIFATEIFSVAPR